VSSSIESPSLGGRATNAPSSNRPTRADRGAAHGGRDPAIGLRQWPLAWGDAGRFAVAYAVLCAIGIAVGELITHPLRNSAVQRMDTSIERWLADHRTAWLNRATFIGSELADTAVKIGVTVLVALVMLAVWRRWLEPLMVSLALVLEASAFITITWIVGRPRPAVQRLETSPVGSSFPSGHVAAAVVYGGIVVVVFWHTRKRWARALAVTVVACVVLAAGFSRMYRGMHHLTDVIFGALLGLAAVFITQALLVRAARRRHCIPAGLTISADEPQALSETTAG
jgi:membrane-associated phospholipid phosphatase